jgi:hypothetical protein
MDQYYIAYGTYPTGTASAGGSGALLSDPAAFDSSLEPLIPSYVPFMPNSPNPPDGSCTQSGRNSNEYWYDSSMDGLSYTITFCLGKGTESWPAGVRYATPEGVK